MIFGHSQCGAGDTDGADRPRMVRFADCHGQSGRAGLIEIRIVQHGAVKKLVQTIEQITYSGQQALKRGHEALFVTERAVFKLTADGLVLSEVAPGIDVKADILDQMGFHPLIPTSPVTMDRRLFT
jgi:propionate CoA-transferase